jgi:hypothetical protein
MQFDPRGGFISKTGETAWAAKLPELEKIPAQDSTLTTE